MEGVWAGPGAKYRPAYPLDTPPMIMTSSMVISSALWMEGVWAGPGAKYRPAYPLDTGSQQGFGIDEKVAQGGFYTLLNSIEIWRLQMIGVEPYAASSLRVVDSKCSRVLRTNSSGPACDWFTVGVRWLPQTRRTAPPGSTAAVRARCPGVTGGM